MRQLAESARVGHLGTVSADGQPHVVPVCSCSLARPLPASTKNPTDHAAAPDRQRDGDRSAACWSTSSEDWTALWWVRLDGHGRVVDDPHEAACRLVCETVPQYAGWPCQSGLAVMTRWSAWSASKRRTGAPPPRKGGSLCDGWVLSRKRVETDEELRDGESK
jgi:hypothetical protein